VRSGRGEAHVGRPCASRGASAGSRGGRSARGRRSRRGAASRKARECARTARRRPQAVTEKRVSPSAHAVIFTAVVDLIPHPSGTGARASSEESAVKRLVGAPLARGACGICRRGQGARRTTTKTRRCGYRGRAHPTRHGAEAARARNGDGALGAAPRQTHVAGYAMRRRDRANEAPVSERRRGSRRSGSM
jgi:hypothetical protein